MLFSKFCHTLWLERYSQNNASHSHFFQNMGVLLHKVSYMHKAVYRKCYLFVRVSSWFGGRGVIPISTHKYIEEYNSWFIPNRPFCCRCVQTSWKTWSNLPPSPSSLGMRVPIFQYRDNLCIVINCILYVSIKTLIPYCYPVGRSVVRPQHCLVLFFIIQLQ